MRNFSWLIGAALALALALALASSACIASSRIGNVVITQSNGAPCFGIPDNTETRDGLPLSTVIVTKHGAPDVTSPPVEVWFSWIEPRGRTIILKPKNCIRYGVMPAPAHQELLVPLQAYAVYSVTLDAAPVGSSLQGYKSEFCMIPDAAKKLRVQVIPWDKQTSAWRYDLCASRNF